jgi:hypothetical protein
MVWSNVTWLLVLAHRSAAISSLWIVCVNVGQTIINKATHISCTNVRAPFRLSFTCLCANQSFNRFRQLLVLDLELVYEQLPFWSYLVSSVPYWNYRTANATRHVQQGQVFGSSDKSNYYCWRTTLSTCLGLSSLFPIPQIFRFCQMMELLSIGDVFFSNNV